MFNIYYFEIFWIIFKYYKYYFLHKIILKIINNRMSMDHLNINFFIIQPSRHEKIFYSPIIIQKCRNRRKEQAKIKFFF